MNNPLCTLRVQRGQGYAPTPQITEVQNMNNYVSTRIKARTSAQAVQAIYHDIRATRPGYLAQDDTAVRAVLYTHGQRNGKGGEITLSNAKYADEAFIKELKVRLRRPIMDSIAEQQQIYKDKLHQTPQRRGNWTISGILTFSADGIKDLTVNELWSLGLDAIERQAQDRKSVV